MTKLNLFEWEKEFEYDYIQDADILEVFFSRGTATNAVEIAEDVTLRFNQETRQPVSLILNNYSYLTQPAQFGPRSFRLKLEHLSPHTKETILAIISQPPVSRFLHTLTYTTSRQKFPIATVVVH